MVYLRGIGQVVVVEDQDDTFLQTGYLVEQGDSERAVFKELVRQPTRPRQGGEEQRVKPHCKPREEPRQRSPPGAALPEDLV